jgi:uncharacterized protein
VSGERFLALDAMRGIAVMGILAMNIIAFAMPEPAYLNPMAWGQESAADLYAWAVGFVLVESKMRGLFSLLFGASMLLVYTRAEEANGNGGEVHVRRMVWLLVFGLIHCFLIWFGDILALYALCGLAAIGLLRASPSTRLKIGIGLLTLNTLIYMLVAVFFHVFSASAAGDPAMASEYRDFISEFGGAGPGPMMEMVNTMRGSYARIVADRVTNDLWGPAVLFFASGAETIGLFAIGMWLFGNGFLTGTWAMAEYRRWAVIGYAIGLPPLIALTVWCFASGMDTITLMAVSVGWSVPFRIAVMIGHASLAMMLIKTFAGTPIMARIAATGRVAFTNYIGTSIVMTTVFYGYGLGLYGHLSRIEAYALCVPAWAVMLLWSKPWLDRYGYGPLEWAWRSLARGQLQIMRKN